MEFIAQHGEAIKMVAFVVLALIAIALQLHGNTPTDDE